MYIEQDFYFNVTNEDVLFTGKKLGKWTGNRYHVLLFIFLLKSSFYRYLTFAFRQRDCV